MEFQSPRGVGVVQTREIVKSRIRREFVSITSRCRGGSDDSGQVKLNWQYCVSITSRCRGGSDCKPTSLHGYAANRNLNFKKTFILFHFCHPFDYILAQFF